jgi:hypothetical protein
MAAQGWNSMTLTTPAIEDKEGQLAQRVRTAHKDVVAAAFLFRSASRETEFFGCTLDRFANPCRRRSEA